METNSYNPFSLAGKTILVTGASSGIGRTTAINCSRMGARVVVTARDQSLQFGTRDRFDVMFEVNFFSPVELMRLMYKKKILKKGASVVLMASIGGTHSYMPGNGVYGASKAALNSVMKYAAREYAARKVRVNSICPGMVDTPLIHRGVITDEQLAEDAKKYPLGRYGRPEDIASGVVYLLSDASSWLTGHDLVIDGGFSI